MKSIRSSLLIATASLFLATGLATVHAAEPTNSKGHFLTELNEAKANTVNGVGAPLLRTDREVALIHLGQAESLYRAGNEVKAWDYLNFARGKLGFNLRPSTAPAPLNVAVRPDTH